MKKLINKLVICALAILSIGVTAAQTNFVPQVVEDAELKTPGAACLSNRFIIENKSGTIRQVCENGFWVQYNLMTKSIYDVDNDGSVDIAEVAGSATTALRALDLDVDGDNTPDTDWDGTTLAMPRITTPWLNAGAKCIDADGDGTCQLSFPGSYFSFDFDDNGGEDLTVATTLMRNAADAAYGYASRGALRLTADHDNDTTGGEAVEIDADGNGIAESTFTAAGLTTPMVSGKHDTDSDGTADVVLVVPYYLANIPASQNPGYLYYQDSSLVDTRYVVGYSGKIVRMNCYNSGPSPAGENLTLTAYNLSDTLASDVVISMTIGSASFTNFTDSTCTSNCIFDAGDQLAVRFVTTASWTSTSLDAHCELWLHVTAP